MSMWPYIIAAVNQATDPAKKLADDYITYVTSQGGTTDYTTIYNLYKDEYLTDPNKDRMLDWYDFRAGLKFTTAPSIDKIYSLIPPYRTNGNRAATAPELISGDRINDGRYLGQFDFSVLNSYDKFKVIHKSNVINPTASSQYQFLSYDYINSADAAVFGLRLNTSGSRKRSYLYHWNPDTSAYVLQDLSPAINISDGIVIHEQIIDYVNRTHTVTNNVGYNNSLTMTANTERMTIASPSGTMIGTRMWGWPYSELFWIKLYSMP